MASRWPGARVAISLLLLCLAGGPIASGLLAASDPHSCCAESESASERPASCQYVAPLVCCAQLGVPATATSDAPSDFPGGLVAADLAAFRPIPPVQFLARARNGHGPPQAALVRTTVLQI